jgi:hypothetical protein
MPLYRTVVEKRQLPKCKCCSLDNEAHQWQEQVQVLSEGTTLDKAQEALLDQIEYLSRERIEFRNDRVEMIEADWKEVT